MQSHRNPRQKLSKSPTTNNPGPRRKRGATGTRRARLDPRAAAAIRIVLDLLASVDRRRAMRFLEAVSLLVTLASGPEEP